MPRISPYLLRQARRIDPFLSSLLPVCRDLRSAQNELRWLGEYATKVADGRQSHKDESNILRNYVSRRAKGEPLQYILGTEYFGDLEIKCRPGVLIPRQETAAAVSHLVRLLSTTWMSQMKGSRSTVEERGRDAVASISMSESNPFEGVPSSLHVYDLCTGTGCIPLLFAHELHSQPGLPEINTKFVGADISPQALNLARENLRGTRRFQQTHFVQADLLAETFTAAIHRLSGDSNTPIRCDILISNPPYISSEGFRKTTGSSVRKYEPKLALVPRTAQGEKHDGDVFYLRLLEEAEQLQAKIFLFEVADMEQAKRVAHLALRQGIWEGVEIWRDDPAGLSKSGKTVSVSDRDVKVYGEGHGRCVVAYRGEGTGWLGRRQRRDQ